MIISKNLIPDDLWDDVVDSSMIGMAKPDEDIYRYAEDAVGFSGPEILFIENTQTHINTAKALGWQTFLYDPSNIEKSNDEVSKYL